MTVAETLVAGRYRIGPSLGAGGMGRVWLARDEVLRRDVAIKEIALPFGLTDEEREEMRQRTLREARAAARLNHPNVVRIYDVQHGEERPWIVMEYVAARSLAQVIKENGALPVDQTAGIGLAVLSALESANRVGVVHRDVKPSNVLIADDGRVLLTDFGSALIDEGEGALTQTGIILGSPRYIAPERAATGVSSLESDLWSLGATLYEAVEGRAPYTRETTMATLVALATEKPDPLQKAGALKPVIQGLLQKNPNARMKLAEVEERLRRIADVRSAVWLHRVPAPRESPEEERTYVPALADIAHRRDALALPFAGRPPATTSAAPAGPPVTRSAPSTFAPRRRDRWRIVAAAVAAVGAVLAGTTAAAVNGNLPWLGSDEPERLRTIGVDAAAQPEDTPAPTPSATPFVLPNGFRWYDSKSGFRIAWPADWTVVDESRTSVVLCAPGGPPYVSVREWGRSDPDLAAAFAREETAGNLRKYKRIRMDVTGPDTAEREYTFTDPEMGAMHVVQRAVVASGRAYLVEYAAPAARWNAEQDRLDVALASFRPAASAVAASLPAGYTWYTGQSGFRMPQPAKWVKLEETRTTVLFCAPGGPPLVKARTWRPSSPDLEVALAREEGLAGLARYKRVSLQVIAGGQGAVWEYTFTDPNMGRMHGLERAFVTPNGSYLVQWRTPADKWAENLSKIGVITTFFRPVDGTTQ